MEDIQEITGPFENGFYVNTDVTKFIDGILGALGDLICIGELKEPVTIDRNLCIRISRLFNVNADISVAPIKVKYFYVNIGLLNFIYRILKVGLEGMIQTTVTMTNNDYLLEVCKHPLISSIIKYQ